MELTKLEVTSPSFKDDEMIPAKYTADDENINPGLNIDDVPEEAKSLVVIVDDPDALNGMANIYYLNGDNDTAIQYGLTAVSKDNFNAIALSDLSLALEAKIKEVHAVMSEPEFYHQDRAEIAKAVDELKQLEEELARVYARWEELEALN